MRRDRPVSDTTASAVIAAGLGVIVAVTLAMAAVHDRREPEAKPTPAVTDPYEHCLDAADTPGPAGFATEVCEPLSQGYEHPAMTLYPSDFGVDGCVTFPARPDSDPIVYCPKASR